MDTARMFSYLADLEAHNEREWFHAHKADYQAIHAEFEALIERFMLALAAAEPAIAGRAPKELTFKMMRDTRFSADKSPYFPALRAHIGPGGKLPIPTGYFICLRPGDRSFLGGGLCADSFKDATARIRAAIAADPDGFRRVIREPSFTARFTVRGVALKNVPKEYDPAHPMAAYLKQKSWYLEYPLPDALVLDGERFFREAVEVFEAMRPFNAFLNHALEGFEMPAR